MRRLHVRPGQPAGRREDLLRPGDSAAAARRVARAREPAGTHQHRTDASRHHDPDCRADVFAVGWRRLDLPAARDRRVTGREAGPLPRLTHGWLAQRRRASVRHAGANKQTGMTMPISQKIRALIDNAWGDGYPCLLATAGSDGPNISPKGSMLVYDDDHLAYWERSKKQALANLGTDRHVCVMYSNFKAQRDGMLESGFLRFYGIAELYESGPQ